MNNRLPTLEATAQNEQFRQSVAYWSEALPEVTAQQDAIERGGANLIEEFAIQPEFFDDHGRSLFFLSLAARNADLESSKDELTVDNYTTQKEFIGSATAMLVNEYSGIYDSFAHLLSLGGEVSPEAKRAAYDEFTLPDLTADLKQAIDEGLLDDIKARMGITAENEDDYDVRVLDIAGVGPVLGGMYPQRPITDNEQVIEEWRNDLRSFVRYQKDLETKAARFQQLAGMSQVPPAWVSMVDGRPSLNIPRPIAEKLFRPETLPRFASYTDSDRAVDLSVVKHEYAHTQGGLHIDFKQFIGIAFEERRAEFYSGDGAGYQDAKAFILDLAVLGIVNTYRWLREHPKGGDPVEFYAGIARSAGLQNMLEMALLSPVNYIDRAGHFQQSVDRYLGGQDAFTRRLYEQRTANPGTAGLVSEGLEKMVAMLVEETPEERDLWYEVHGALGQSAFITAKIKDLVDARLASQQER